MKTIDTITEISYDELVTVQGGAAHGRAINTWGQKKPGVRANEYLDGTLRIHLPKTIVKQFPNGQNFGITSRGELVLQPKAPYGH